MIQFHPKVNPWLLLLLVVLAVVPFLPTWSYLIEEWLEESSTFSHGLIVVPVALWMLFTRTELGHNSVLQNLMPLVTLGLGLVWLIGWAAGVFVLQAVVMPLAVAALLIAAFGWPKQYDSLKALALLYTAIPLWQPMVNLLQYLATAATTHLLRIFSIPAYVEGNQIDLISGSFVIEKGCSGISFFLAGITLAAMYSLISRHSNWQTVITIALAAATAVVSNWIRIFLIVYWGHTTQMQTSLVEDHGWFGWIIFALLVIPTLMWRFSRLDKLEQESAPSSQIEPAAKSTTNNIVSGFATKPALITLSLFLLILGPLWARHVDNKAQVNEQYPWLESTQWHDVQEPTNLLEINGASCLNEKVLETSNSPGHRDATVQLTQAAFRHQSQGKKIISSETVMHGYRQSDFSTHRLANGENVQERIGRQGTSLLWSWYILSDKEVGTPMAARIALLQQTLQGNSAGTLALLHTQCASPDCDDARARLSGAKANLSVQLKTLCNERGIVSDK